MKAVCIYIGSIITWYIGFVVWYWSKHQKAEDFPKWTSYKEIKEYLERPKEQEPKVLSEDEQIAYDYVQYRRNLPPLAERMNLKRDDD